MTMTAETDEALAKKVQGGDRDAFADLVERYEAKMLRYGHRFLSSRDDIDDIVQDVFIKTYQNMQSFDTAQRFSPWIYRIAHNEFVSELRKSSRRPYVPFDFDALVSHTVYEDPVEEERERAEMLQMIEAGLEKISASYKEVLILHYLEGLGYKEIADIIQVPIGTVGVRLKRAKESLRKVMKENYGA